MCATYLVVEKMLFKLFADSSRNEIIFGEIKKNQIGFYIQTFIYNIKKMLPRK